MMDSGNKRYWGYIAVILAACFFAVIGTLTKVAYNLNMTTLQILTVQAVMASSILLCYGLIFRPQVLYIDKRQIPKLIIQGIVGSLGTAFLFSSALLYLPVSLSTMLLFTYPVFVTLGAFIFFREAVKTTHLLAVALAVGGTMLSTQFWQIAAGSLTWRGILFGLGSALAYSFFILYGEYILNRLEPLTALTYIQVFSTIVLVLYQLPAYIFKSAVLVANWSQFLIGIAMATVASIVPFWLLLEGIKYIGATRASVIGVLELPVAFVFAFAFLGERFGLWQAAGAVCIIASVFLLRLKDGNSRVDK